MYKIGGDEFLMIIDNPGHGEAESMIASAREKLAEDNVDHAIKISSAVGLAFGKGEDILKVVEAADSQMYENKKLGKESRK